MPNAATKGTGGKLENMCMSSFPQQICAADHRSAGDPWSAADCWCVSPPTQLWGRLGKCGPSALRNKMTPRGACVRYTRPPGARASRGSTSARAACRRAQRRCRSAARPRLQDAARPPAACRGTQRLADCGRAATPGDGLQNAWDP